MGWCRHDKRERSRTTLTNGTLVVGAKIDSALARPIAGCGKVQLPDACLKDGAERLLDDARALLYCDHEFDRQFAISLS